MIAERTPKRGGHAEVEHQSGHQHRNGLDRKLDEALQESFPGSDPVNVTQPPPSKHDKPNKQKH
jgi:hypothetical protein